MWHVLGYTRASLRVSLACIYKTEVLEVVHPKHTHTHTNIQIRMLSSPPPLPAGGILSGSNSHPTPYLPFGDAVPLAVPLAAAELNTSHPTYTPGRTQMTMATVSIPNLTSTPLLTLTPAQLQMPMTHQQVAANPAIALPAMQAAWLASTQAHSGAPAPAPPQASFTSSSAFVPFVRP